VKLGKPEMLYQPLHRYQLRTGTTYSAYSLPDRTADETCEIHLIKAEDPGYIPGDMEVWPLYHRTILGALQRFPDAHRAAIEAVRKTQQEIKGKENPKIPPGSRPRW
jgi:hypothetical protein